MPKINKNIITYDREDWLAGLHPQHYTASLDFMPMGDNGFSFMQATNPYKYVGCLTAGPNGTAITNASTVMTSYIKQGVNTGQKAFLIEDTKLHYLNVSTKTLLNDTAGVGYPHILAHGAHTSIVTSDIVLYNHKVGGTSALRGLYSFSDATDWDIGTFDLATSGSATFDDDFMSTAPATPLAAPYLTEGKGYPHPMIIGYDDICYIADRNFVHAYDGQSSADNDGKFYPEALTIPKEYTIYGFARLAPRSLAIFASTTTQILYQANSKVVVFIWNYLDLDPDYIKDIPENMVTAPFEYNGTVGCFAYGRLQGYTGLYLLNGSSGQFERVTKFYGDGYKLLNGGVNVLGDEIRWLCGGKLFSYGNQYNQKFVLNQWGAVDYVEAGYGHGMFKRFSDSNGDFVSTDTKNLKYLVNYDNSNGIFYTTFFPTDRIRITKIKTFFAQTCSGIGFELSVGSYNDTEYEVIDIDSIGTDDLVIVNHGLDTAGDKIPVLNGLYLHGKFTGGTGVSDAPVLRKIEIEFEPVEFTS